VLGERGNLGDGHPSEKHSHRPGRHLVVGHIAAHIAGDSAHRSRSDESSPPSRFFEMIWTTFMVLCVFGGRSRRRQSPLSLSRAALAVATTSSPLVVCGISGEQTLGDRRQAEHF